MSAWQWSFPSIDAAEQAAPEAYEEDAERASEEARQHAALASQVRDADSLASRLRLVLARRSAANCWRRASAAFADAAAALVAELEAKARDAEEPS